jgi:hypothetical protein
LNHHVVRAPLLNTTVHLFFLRSVDQQKVFSKEQFDAHIAKLGQVEPGFVIVETPAADLKAIGKLLDLPAGFTDGKKYFVKVADSAAKCRNCNCQFSFLDFVSTGFGVHEKQFMKDVIMGKYGCIINPNKPNLHKCNKCGQPAVRPFDGYWCPVYSC